MLLVFVDESGKPTTKEMDPYVVAALIMHDRDFLDVSLAIDRIVEDTVAKVLGLDPREIEVHARSIVQGMGIYRRVPPAIRAKLLAKVVDLVSSLEGRIWLLIVVGTKGSTALREKEARRRGVQIVYSALVRDIASSLPRFGKEMVLIIVDSSELDRDVQHAVSSTIVEELWSSSIAFRMLVDRPLFLSSKRYRPLQLADVVAYTFRRIALGKPRAMGNLFDFESYASKISKLLAKKPRKIKLWQPP